VIYILSGVHTKHITSGMNIQSLMMAFEAVSKEEAIGKYIIYANNKFPEHNLFQRPLSMSVEDAQQAIKLDEVTNV